MTIHDEQQQATIDPALLAHLPTDFLWGASTSAYQIEGATQEDGRGRSIWDDFSATPGKTHEGQTGEIADDHYHRVPEDLALMNQLGLNAYCFSIAWPRVLPTGTGSVNVSGLDFYDRLVDALLARGITPLAKLYHWDLPSALQQQGGWLNRDTAYAFADYAEYVTRKLGDRVQLWATHNEPFCTTYLGHGIGIHAPGLKDSQASITAGHHVLLSHGLAVPRIRANTPPGTKVGISLDYYPVYGVDDSPETLKAVEQAYDFRNGWFFDPVFKGRYPKQLFSCLGVLPPPMHEGDLDIISTPIDFLGLNYYTRMLVRARDQQQDHKDQANQIYEQIAKIEGASYTEMDWEIFPDGLRKALEDIHHTYAPPAIYVTESGAAFVDTIDDASAVHDAQRAAYLREHIQSIALAARKGVPVKGYFAWSLMDNFEWGLGYSKRFGIVYVDFDTLQRRIKDSGYWYASLIASHKL